MGTDYHSRKKLEERYRKCKAENAALKRENEGLREAFGYICDDSLEDVLADKKEQADALAALLVYRG